jgi:hypothetical protein
MKNENWLDIRMVYLWARLLLDELKAEEKVVGWRLGWDVGDRKEVKTMENTLLCSGLPSGRTAGLLNAYAGWVSRRVA